MEYDIRQMAVATLLGGAYIEVQLSMTRPHTSGHINIIYYTYVLLLEYVRR